jgi:GMP synthase (glutamine-hydrolysing)
MDKILVLDFGSQTTALIGRRIRELGVYSEVIPGDTAFTDEFLAGAAFAGVKGLILSGSPESVYAEGSPVVDKRVYSLEIGGAPLPLLGICYGLQRMTADLGGEVKPLPKVEYGRRKVALSKDVLGLKAGETFTAWMSHGDTLTRLAPGFAQLGTSETGYPAVVAAGEKPWFGVQFHPEVTHCERGMDILAAFVFGVCGCEKDWSVARYVEEMRVSLRKRVGGPEGTSPVLLLISGGVDSTVAAALLLKTLDPAQIYLLYIDTGLMRKDETAQVRTSLEKLGARHLYILDCEEEFLSALKGETDPETKRKIIGDLFITVQEREVARLGLPESYFLAQGTLYTDLIESGKGVGKKAHLIKSHHNVGSPLVAAKRAAGRIIEPLDKLYKDEVRALGRLLGVDEEVIRRHPFPGPGLAVRILGEVTKEKCAILREADAIFMEELKRRVAADGKTRLYDAIWQAFAVLLPVRSVGVAGDVRKYGYVLALRAITSADGMTADVYPFEMRDLLEISTRITNTVKDVGRVAYDISS